MYIIVMGGGQVGYHLTRTLMLKEHEVPSWRRIHDGADHQGTGPGRSRAICEFRTPVVGTNRADVVAVVIGDTHNLPCQLEAQVRVSRTIARVNDPRNEEIFRRLGSMKVEHQRIDDLIEQEMETVI